MNTIITLLLPVLLAAQPDTSTICSTTLGATIGPDTIGTAEGYGSFFIINSLKADSLTLWVNDRILDPGAQINGTSEFGYLAINLVYCPAEVIALSLGNADAIFINQIVLAILDNLQAQVMYLDADTCLELNKPQLEMMAQQIKFTASFVESLREQIEMNVSGRNLELWTFFKPVGDVSLQQVINFSQRYIDLLQEPCSGTNGQPLGARIGGALDFVTDGLRRVHEHHEAMKNTFTL